MFRGSCGWGHPHRWGWVSKCGYKGIWGHKQRAPWLGTSPLGVMGVLEVVPWLSGTHLGGS